MESAFKEHDQEEAQIISWFITGLRHEAIRLAKKNKELRQQELLILNEQVRNNYEEDDFGDMSDSLIAKSDTPVEAETRIFLQEAFSLLTPLQKQIIVETVLEGATEMEIAQRNGITHQAVSRIKERGLKRLRKHFVLDKPNRQEESYPGRKTTLTQG